jgi:osmotically-inducible protein OsmY
MTDDDKRLQRQALDELQWDASVDATHIGVAADRGVVTLTGHVKSYAQKLATERAIKRVRGVKAIAQELAVHLPFAAKTADDEIATRALRILEWDAAVPANAVTVKVEKGWVTLSGSVPWQYQRAAAERAVQKLNGVVGVINSIAIRQAVRPGDVLARIEEALRRDAQLQAKGITVTDRDGRIELTGKVHSWQERWAAEQAAWSAPGVTQVDDRLTVA